MNEIEFRKSTSMTHTDSDIERLGAITTSFISYDRIAKMFEKEFRRTEDEVIIGIEGDDVGIKFIWGRKIKR